MLTRTHSGIVSCSGSFREVLSGDNTSLGAVMSWSNGVTLKDANLDGWICGEGRLSIPYTSGDYQPLYIGRLSDPLGAMGDAEFLTGFTPVGSRLFALYFEMITNPSGDGYGRSVSGGASGYTMAIEHPDITWAGYISVVGDVFYNLNQNQLGTTDASDYLKLKLLTSAGATAPVGSYVTFRAGILYRNAQYPVK